MEADEFWQVIKFARTGLTSHDGGAQLAFALTADLATRDLDDILEWDAQFDEAMAALSHWNVWAAAYLIGGGCSDDGFEEFRAGIVTLGQEWFDRVRDEPDELAEHRQVQLEAAEGYERGLFTEPVLYVADQAVTLVVGDDGALVQRRTNRRGGGLRPRDVRGERFYFDDEEEMRRRLPRLAELFMG